MKRKIIGCPGWIDSKTGQFGVGQNHLAFINKFGNPRIIMPWEELANVDCLYLAGGLDINPSSYGELPEYHTSNTDVFKQFFYDNRLKGYIKKGLPIYGVCAGFQSLCAFFGSKLTQNLMYHPQSEERGTYGHEIIILDEDGTYSTHKEKIKKTGEEIEIPDNTQQVNSHHHQGVLRQDLGKELIPLAIYEDFDGDLVEAARHKTLPIVMVQYHPEEVHNELAIELFEEILTFEEVEMK